MAVESRQLSSDVAVLEEEGLISKRLKELQHQTEALEARAAKNAKVNSFPVFTSNANIGDFLKSPLGAGHVFLVDMHKAHAWVTPGTGITFSSTLTCRLEGDNVEEAAMKALRAKMVQLKFAIVNPDAARQESVVVSGSLRPATMDLGARNVEVRSVTPGNLKMSCFLALPTDQDPSEAGDIVVSQDGRILSACTVSHGW